MKNCRAIGITVPIFCGIFLTNIFLYGRLTGICYPADKKSIHHATKLYDSFEIRKIIKLLQLENDIENVHVFTLNDLQLCKEILK